MLAVRGIYTGKTVRLLQKVGIRHKSNVIVTFLDEEPSDTSRQSGGNFRSLKGAYRKALHTSTSFSRMKKTEKKRER